MPETLPLPCTGRYATEEELTESLSRKGTALPGSGLYPRDGTETVTAIESAISEVTIPEQHLNVVVGAGMSAVSGAVRFGLATTGNERGNPAPLAHARELYEQSTRVFDNLRSIGVARTTFDSGDATSVGRVVAKNPGVIFAETVANTPGMPVLDVMELLERTRTHASDKDRPIAVLDNTLPLSTGIDFNSMLTPDDRVLIVESPTKSAMHNGGLLGAVYSKNEELMDGFRKFKATEGLVTSTQADQEILEALEATIPGFHSRNRALFESTGRIAVALADAQAELGRSTDFTVDFPLLPNHDNYDYADEHLVNGVSPVVFMACTNFEEGSARNLYRRISKHPRILELINDGQIYGGQSFGFKEASLLYSHDANYVRIAGGYDVDQDALADAIYEAAADA
ncbi:hypothetical protein COY17_01105 [Candidatus Saccharibacteria bacterium CG_4_10_14_0_2_um_filter_52_9]|nr:MAG: hypothetical protein COY17_01105 [Candidatus Saccharibacteria bacterium CG_4_10_14_0_2_um_filter_52_9]